MFSTFCNYLKMVYLPPAYEVRGKVMFLHESVCLSTLLLGGRISHPANGGRGYPIRGGGMVGGLPHPRSGRGDPIPRGVPHPADRGVTHPRSGWGGTPVQVGGVPHPTSGGVPHPRSGQGVPHPRSRCGVSHGTPGP